TQTVTTPILERMEFMDPLVHAETAPDTGAAVPVRSPSVVQQTTTMSGKSKKEVKAEEKLRKVAEKERVKGEEMKRKEASARRVEAWKKQDEELKRVMEESKATAVEEMKKRGDEGTTAFSEKAGGGGGALGRFRHGSMSLRGKPKLFGKDKEANGNGNGNGNGEKLASIPQRQATVSGAHEGVAKERERNGDPAMEEKKVKNRFSLGRKKSQGLS
ncbi:hypothetical protein LTR48_005563, partial [Friedmanniomyces endolithicus]